MESRAPEIVDRVIYGEDGWDNRLRARGDDAVVLVHVNHLGLPSAELAVSRGKLGS